MFITYELEMDRAEAIAAVRGHVEAADDWLFPVKFGLAGGRVMALKICYLPLGHDVISGHDAQRIFQEVENSLSDRT